MNAVDKDRQEDNGDRQEAMVIGAVNNIRWMKKAVDKDRQEAMAMRISAVNNRWQWRSAQ
jgi:hypothetical protein